MTNFLGTLFLGALPQTSLGTLSRDPAKGSAFGIHQKPFYKKVSGLPKISDGGKNTFAAKWVITPKPSTP
ncbi:MAG: hypothetical protein IJX08_07050, partial [Clostridia bacterium]|nr:hypothetical protein [Clostridia bacterium]